MNQLTVAAHNQELELWIERIRTCRSSGMTVSEWCGANNIGSLPVERKSRGAVTPLTSSFAEVPIPKTILIETIRVHLAQAVVDIPDGASSATIADVLHVIKQIC